MLSMALDRNIYTPKTRKCQWHFEMQLVYYQRAGEEVQLVVLDGHLWLYRTPDGNVLLVRAVMLVIPCLCRSLSLQSLSVRDV